jgi:hypothetical protein
MLETSRRTVLACAGAACAATLAGCSTYNSNSGGVDAPQGAQSTESSSAPAAAGSGGSGGGGGGGAALAKTSDVPVGGGTILTDKKIVITQPQSGTFHAFTAVCTHANGSVVNGPAASPLAPINIKVQGTSILQA